MKKTLAFVMICMLVFAACSVASASWVSYSGKSLPKISSAITPNVTLVRPIRRAAARNQAVTSLRLAKIRAATPLPILSVCVCGAQMARPSLGNYGTKQEKHIAWVLVAQQ